MSARLLALALLGAFLYGVRVGRITRKKTAALPEHVLFGGPSDCVTFTWNGTEWVELTPNGTAI